MIAILQIPLLVLAGLFMGYLALLSILALCARLRPMSATAKTRRFAVIVPAHNEEMAIEKTVKSLTAIDYPKNQFDVIVVADNCTDQTAELARLSGARVMERTNDTQKSKGYALRWCFDELLNATPAYDAFVVIDADSTASANFLSVMNEYLERGAQVVQSSDMVEPHPGAWSSEMTRLGFTLYNFVRPLGKRMLGCSAGIRGNGMCFSADLLKKIPWSTYSLTEDLEYGLILQLQGINVAFAPEAEVLATMPVNVKNAETQRARWEGGRFPVVKQYFPKLFFRAIEHFSIPALDMAIDLVLPPFVNLFGMVNMLLAANLILFAMNVGSMALVLAWAVILFLGMVHVLVGLKAARADEGQYRILWEIPRYAAWKLLLYFKFARRLRQDQWIRTTREQAATAPLPDEN